MRDRRFPATLVLLLAGLLTAAVAAADEPLQDFRAFTPDAAAANPQGAAGDDGTLVGVIYPQGRYLLALQVSGVVAEVLVEAGQTVVAGQPLLVLEREVEALELERLALVWRDTTALDAARQRLALVEERLAALRGLFEASGSISRDEIRDLELQRVALAADMRGLEVQEAREALDYRIGEGRMAQRTLYAPVSGSISEITVKPGEWVQSGDPVVELIDSVRNFVRLNLTSREVAGVDIGTPVALEIEGETQMGTVSFIAPVADPASSRIEVKLTFDNPGNRFRPGLSAHVRFPGS